MGSFKSCRGCTERYPACHDSCEKYRKEKELYEQKKKAAKSEVALYVTQSISDRKDRDTMKRKRLSGYRNYFA